MKKWLVKQDLDMVGREHESINWEIVLRKLTYAGDRLSTDTQLLEVVLGVVVGFGLLNNCEFV